MTPSVNYGELIPGVQNQINRIRDAIADSYTAVSEKGGEMPSVQNVANLATAISSIPSVSVSSKTITANGTYTAPSGQAYSPVTVNVPSKAVQVSNKIGRVTVTGYTATDVSLTVAKTGVYTVQWCGYRSGATGTYGSQLYIDDSAYGTAQTTWSGKTQEVTLNNVSLTAGQTITVGARSNGSSTQIYVAGLVITEV